MPSSAEENGCRGITCARQWRQGKEKKKKRKKETTFANPLRSRMWTLESIGSISFVCFQSYNQVLRMVPCWNRWMQNSTSKIGNYSVFNLATGTSNNYICNVVMYFIWFFLQMLILVWSLTNTTSNYICNIVMYFIWFLVENLVSKIGNK